MANNRRGKRPQDSPSFDWKLRGITPTSSSDMGNPVEEVGESVQSIINRERSVQREDTLYGTASIAFNEPNDTVSQPMTPGTAVEPNDMSVNWTDGLDAHMRNYLGSRTTMERTTLTTSSSEPYPNTYFNPYAINTTPEADKFFRKKSKPSITCKMFTGELKILNDRNIVKRTRIKEIYSSEWNNARYEIQRLFDNQEINMISKDALMTAAKLRLNTLNRKTELKQINTIFSNIKE